MGILIGGVIWILLCVAVGKCAERWDRSFGAWFFLSILFSPLLIGIILLITGRNTGSGSVRGKSPNQRLLSDNEKRCKSCGSIITVDYNRCPNCGSGDFTDSNMNVDLSEVGKVAINSGKDFIVCPFCKIKITLDIPASEFKKMKCTKCGNKITSENVLFEE
jgi:predicted RNA-binding Zn-ribbon protein involved in translation (DUF1610 family)